MAKFWRLIFPLFFISVGVAFGQQLPKIYLDTETHYLNGDFEACAKLEAQVEKFGNSRKDTLSANTFFYLSDAFFQLGSQDKGMLYAKKVNDVLKQTGIDQKYVSTMLFNLADLYTVSGKYSEAGEMAEELLKTDRKLYKVTSEEFVNTAMAVGDIYFKLDRLKDEENILLTTHKQQIKNSLNEGLLLNKLGDLYTYKGEYTKALQALTRAIDIFKQILNESSVQYLSATGNLGTLFMQQGKYPEAEEQFDDVLRKADPSDPDNIYFPTLNNQALVYRDLGQYEKSILALEKIRVTDSISLGTAHPDYAVTLTNMSTVFTNEGKYKEAEVFITKALDIQKSNQEMETSSYARKLNNLAKIYMLSNRAQQSVSLYEQALGIYKKTVGENSADYATSAYNLGVALLTVGKGEEGFKYLKNSSTIRANVLGKKHPKYAESQQKIADYLWFQKKKKEARQTYGEVFENYYNQIEQIFPALTEEEKAKFYYQTIRPSFDKFNSFAYEHFAEDPSVMNDVYDHQINTKGVIMLATEKVKDAIYGSKDTLLVKKFENWQGIKEQIAKLYSHNQEPAKLDSLLILADKTEKELSRSSGEFARQFIRKKYSWTEIQKTLKPGEAAIEVVRYQKFIPDNGGSFQDEVVYAFLIATSKTVSKPDLVVLKNGKDLEGKYLRFYRNSIQFNQEDANSYKNFFQPIGEYLKQNKIEKLYLSPDGVYNQININTLRNSNTGKFLVDEYTISLVTNTKELIERKPKTAGVHLPVLIGFPKFNMDSEQKSTSSTNRSVSNRGLRGGLLRYVDPQNGITVLPGTQKEIEKISKLMLSSSPKVFVQAQAAEAITKQVSSPSVLHIATHGYFLEDDLTTREESSGYVFNPLLKSGLILSGAENFIRSGTAVDSLGNDGILTAYEAMNLNLEGTDLVVLSACETGLGEVRNGEGVYGLQRAFKLSGAKSVIMSLWNVDDEATQDLMMLFYTEFAKHGDPQEALRWAQRKLKNKYPLPVHWGAFVLIGI